MVGMLSWKELYFIYNQEVDSEFRLCFSFLFYLYRFGFQLGEWYYLEWEGFFILMNKIKVIFKGMFRDLFFLRFQIFISFIIIIKYYNCKFLDFF